MTKKMKHITKLQVMIIGTEKDDVDNATIAIRHMLLAVDSCDRFVTLFVDTMDKLELEN